MVVFEAIFEMRDELFCGSKIDPQGGLLTAAEN